MKRAQKVNKSLRSQKPRASRIVTLSEADRGSLFEAALAGTIAAKEKPKPETRRATSDVLDELISFLVDSDTDAEAEHIVEGAMDALRSGILGGNFVAPADATVLARVKQQIKKRQTHADVQVSASARPAFNDIDDEPFNLPF